jgi:hypothetical protein
MTGIKILSVAATVEGTSLICGLDVQLWARMGMVGMLLVAVIALWRATIEERKRADDAERVRSARLETLIAANTAAMVSTATAVAVNTESSRQVIAVIEKCKGHI